MRGTVAKRLRREAGLVKPYTYQPTNKRMVYLTGRRYFAGKLYTSWGWWFLLYTLVATGTRRAYQKLKHARNS